MSAEQSIKLPAGAYGIAAPDGRRGPFDTAMGGISVGLIGGAHSGWDRSGTSGALSAAEVGFLDFGIFEQVLAAPFQNQVAVFEDIAAVRKLEGQPRILLDQ